MDTVYASTQTIPCAGVHTIAVRGHHNVVTTWEEGFKSMYTTLLGGATKIASIKIFKSQQFIQKHPVYVE